MSFSGLIALLALAAAVVFAVLNQPLLFDARQVSLPGGTYSIPLIGILLAGAAGAIILMLLGEAAALAGWRASNARLARRIQDRDREIVDLKSGAHAAVEDRLEALRHELSEQIDGLARLIEARLPTKTVVRDTVREDADDRMIHRETTVTRQP